LEVSTFMTSKTDGPGHGPAKPAAEGGAPKRPSAIIELQATAVEDKDTGKAKPGNEPESPKAGEQDAEAAAASRQEPTGANMSNAKPTAKPADGDPPGDNGPSDEHAPKSARRSAGVFAHMAAGVIGGFLALLGAFALGPQLGLNGDLWVKHASQLQRRLAAIEQTASDRGAAAADLGAKLAAAESRLARLDDVSKSVTQLAEAQAKLTGDLQAVEQKLGKADALSELGARLAKLEETLAALSAAAANDPQGGVPQLAAITGKLNDLEATLNNRVAALRSSLTQEIDARLAPFAEATETARSATQRIDRELASVKEDAARLTQQVDALKAGGDRFEQALHTAREEMAGFSSALEALKGGIAAQLKNVARAQDVSTAIAAINSKVTAIDENLQGVVKSEEERKSQAELLILGLELRNLRRALDRGGAYAAELAEVVKIAGDKVDLAALERSKDQGVPTVAELSREFRAVAPTVIDAERQPADASVVDRLLMGAKSIVRIRRTETAADDKSAEAILGRMEKALNAARPADALAEAQQLSPKARAAAKAWLDKLEARATVDRAIAQIEDQLKTSLAGNAQMEKRTR
jgi:hypothetical protein